MDEGTISGLGFELIMDQIPLFVVGAHRSGTTWVANALCNHSRIYGVQSPEYGGIVESWFFSHLDGRFGTLGHTDNYRNFLETFQRTPFYQASEVESDELYRLQPANYGDFFLHFMVLAARDKPGCKYLLEKTPLHTLYLPILIEAFPHARFVSIERSLESVVASALKLKVNKSHLELGTLSALQHIVSLALDWQRYQQFMRHFRQKYSHQFCHVVYKNLLIAPEPTFRMCLDFLGLDWETSVLEQRFAPNTSFKNQSVARNEMLNRREVAILRLTYSIVRHIPYPLFELWEQWRRPRTQDPIPFLRHDPAR